MEKSIIKYKSKQNFFEKQLEKVREKSIMNKCDTLFKLLRASGEKGRNDRCIHVIYRSPDEINKIIPSVIIKGYDKSGSIKPLKRFEFDENDNYRPGKSEKNEIVMLDLYEKSLYLYDVKEQNNNITGALIKLQKTKDGQALCKFTQEYVIVNLKNANGKITFESLESFIDNMM